MRPCNMWLRNVIIIVQQQYECASRDRERVITFVSKFANQKYIDDTSNCVFAYFVAHPTMSDKSMQSFQMYLTRHSCLHV